jgi:hypothetical protein
VLRCRVHYPLFKLEKPEVGCVALTRSAVSLTHYLVWTHTINKCDVTVGVSSLATKE